MVSVPTQSRLFNRFQYAGFSAHEAAALERADNMGPRIAQREPASIGIGAAKHEVNPPVRNRPPASVMRSESPTTAERIWPNLRKA